VKDYWKYLRTSYAISIGRVWVTARKRRTALNVARRFRARWPKELVYVVKIQTKPMPPIPIVQAPRISGIEADFDWLDRLISRGQE